jgi:hypothetical protein
MTMGDRLRQVTFAYGALILLLTVEIWISSQPLYRALRPLILAPAALMCGVIAIVFMEIDRGLELARIFVVAALLWLAILLGIGAMDPLTRADHRMSEQLHNAE